MSAVFEKKNHRKDKFVDDCSQITTVVITGQKKVLSFSWSSIPFTWMWTFKFVKTSDELNMQAKKWRFRKTTCFITQFCDANVIKSWSQWRQRHKIVWLSKVFAKSPQFFLSVVNFRWILKVLASLIAKSD